MDVEEQLHKLALLTHEADMLTRVLDDALKAHDEKDGIGEISYFSKIICKKFDEIRNVF